MGVHLTALICGPVFVSPSQALQQVLGADFVFEGTEQATDCLGLMMRHWNWIAAELRRTLAEPHVYLPILLEDDTGVAHGNNWAHGFMRGVQAHPGSWSDLLNSEDEGGALVPMMMLVHEHDPDPEIRPPSMDSAASNCRYSFTGTATSAVSQSTYSRVPASVIWYTVRSGRRPSRTVSRALIMPRFSRDSTTA